MAGKFILLAVMFGAVAALLLQSTTAETYTVGDAMGWAIPPTPETYPNWAAPITFRVGDILVFSFATGVHDVATVTKEAYGSCNTNSPITMQTVSPVAFSLNTTGEVNFICTFGTHCSLGQKFSINVTSAAAAPPPTSPAPATPPPSVTPTAPPPASPISPPPSASTPPPMQAPGVPPTGPPPPAGSPNPSTTPPPAAAPPPGSSPPPPTTTTPTPPNGVSSPPPPSSATRTVGFMGTLLAIAMGLTP